MPGEAVTLQLGHYSGCVGAHWWGLQAAALRSPDEHNELRAAALLRFGRGPGGTESPEPRLVALELKGGVGALRADGEGTEPPVSWDGAVADYRERGRAPRDSGSRRGDAAGDAKGNPGAAGPGSSPAGSQDTPSTRLWSDYLSVNLHPKSLYVIRQYLHDGDCGCLEGFGQGESLLQDPACVEELEDRLHFFVEECDYLQGFQVLCDLHNGFSGVGARVTELLRDEYARKGILTWGLAPVLSAVGDPQKSFYRLMNTALGIAHLSRHSSLLCPLSLNGSLGLKPEPPVTFPYIKYNASLSYHSSAILAAALDTLTAPYRLCSSQASMLHLADSLTFSGRKVVAAWAALPLPAPAGSSLPDVLGAHQDVPWQLLSSCKEHKKLSSCFAQSAVLRGMCREKASRQRESPEQVLQHYLHMQFPGAFSTAHVFQQPCHTQAPFPQFFSPLLSTRGFLQDRARGSSSAAVGSIPVLAALQSCPAVLGLLSGLCRELRPRRWGGSCAAGLELDDVQEALEELRSLAQCYETGPAADGSEDEADSD
ncbi:protein misato homolog 1 [Ammospiza caudacuta]|uniref:protein misato homolog 1 n=1 Tax=Ammospiza caudacuta TaxID=2857398 RepID=UPI002738AD99|nr:protein misato homolog 1 [Ammospiza caudacuta]